MTKFQVQWEDSDDNNWDFEESTQRGGSKQDAQAFTEMLEQTDAGELLAEELQPGDSVSGTILQLSESSDDVIVELEGQQTAFIPKIEVVGAEAKQQYAVGDAITAYVQGKTDGAWVLSLSMSQSMESQ